jgi:hypothetical protein
MNRSRRAARAASSDFLPTGLHPAVGDVVIQAVVEQHRVLRHDADVLAQAGLGDLADVLAVDEDAAGSDIEEAEQQARQGRFAGAAGAHHGQLAAGGDGEADVVQDRPARVVGEPTTFEAHLAGRDGQQFARIRRIDDLRRLVQQAEQLFHVGEGVADLAIHRAEEVERDEQLDQVGVDQHQVAQGHALVGHAPGRQAHHGGDAAGDDEGLAGVQPGQRDFAGTEASSAWRRSLRRRSAS